MFFEGLQSYQEFKASHTSSQLRKILRSMQAAAASSAEEIKMDVIDSETGGYQRKVSGVAVPADPDIEAVKVYVSPDDLDEIMHSDCLAARIMRLMYLAHKKREGSLS